MAAPSMAGEIRPMGQGQTVRLARGATLTDFADKVNLNPGVLVTILFKLGEMVTATQSVSDETLLLLGAELNFDVQIISPEDEDRELLESFDLEFGEDEGEDADLVARPAGRHGDGSRRPRQDPPAGRHPAHQPGGQGGRRDHPAHRRVPGARPTRQRRPACGHLHRHPGPRGVHRHACPWCAGDRHRDPRRRRRRRCEAADDRGAQPRQGGRRADRRRGQQDRQGGRRPDEGARSAHRVRAGPRGVRRRHDVRRRVGPQGTGHRRAARGRAADRGRRARPAGQPVAGRPGRVDRGAPGPWPRPGRDDPRAARHAAPRRLDRGR